ncbi:MAG: glycosyltransferase family 4 protein [Candidatus Binataceae bacterium]
MSVVHFLVPDGIDNPRRPSGGNVYDRRISDGLGANGWSLYEHVVSGSWPRPDTAAYTALTNVLAGLADGAVVLLDGLIASTAPNVLVTQAGRLRLVILLHMPLGDGPPPNDIRTVRACECAVLRAASAVIVTSAWTKTWLCEHYALQPSRIRVAPPGVDSAERVTGTATGSKLICVGAVTPLKGHDVLLAALRTVSDLSWSCTCVGSLEQDPQFVGSMYRDAVAAGIDERIRYTGPLKETDLSIAYAHADLLVLASRRESFGMVVTEALARGLPVIATAVGGISQALGHGADGEAPGLLVPPGAPNALGGALRAWLQDTDLRLRLRRAAGERRAMLSDWSVTVEQISRVLTEATA